MKPFIRILLATILWPLQLGAQKLYLQGDTIRVSRQAAALISFPGPVDRAYALCPEDQYQLVFQENLVTVKVGRGQQQPVSPCALVVIEGSKGKMRQHQFFIIYTTSQEPFRQVHAYNTLELLEARMQALRGPADPAAPAADAAARTPLSAMSGPEPSVRSGPARLAGAHTTQPPADTAVLDLPRIEQQELEARVRDKIQMFHKVCETLIGQKSARSRAMDVGMRLFNLNEHALVQTSNPRSGQVFAPRPVRSYFEHLYQLRYSRVSVTTHDIYYVSGLRRNAAGEFVGTATIIQDFKGYRDLRLVYADQTKKIMEFKVRVWEETREGRVLKLWDVFLLNVMVAQE